MSKLRDTGARIACAVSILACGAGGGNGADAGSVVGDSSASVGADGGTAVDAAATNGSGSGTVTGAVNGESFTNVAASYVLGAPDDPATTVVYLFSKAVECSDLGSPGWDTRIASGTQFAELKVFGKAPATYKVVTTLTPAPGEASVNYTLSSTTGTPAEQSGSGGSVTLKEVRPNASVSGSFALIFGATHLDGTFDSAFCAGGHEP